MADLQGYTMLFLVSLVSVTVLVVRTFFGKTRTRLRLPPSPPALPIIGHLHLLSPLPHQDFQRLSRRYGPLVHLYLGSVSCAVVSSPAIAKEILKTNEALFSNRPRLSVLDRLLYPSSDFIFAGVGPYWKLVKKLCLPQLLGGRTLERLAPVRRGERTRLLKSIAERSGAGEAVDVGGELTRVLSNTVTGMVMSQRCADEDDAAAELRRVVKEAAEVLGRFNASDVFWFCRRIDVQGLWRKSRSLHERFDGMLEKMIGERREARRDGERAGDFLDLLLDMAEDESSEHRLTTDNVKSLVIEIFMAAIDTSYITIEWALAELINNENVMNKAREEIDTVVGKTRLVEESDIAHLPYTQAIVKETLRLHPAAQFIVRESTEKCSINGYDIPEKTRLFVNLWAIGRDPDHWEDALEFKPERFLGHGSDVRGQDFKFMPFGIGARACPGLSLALQLVQTTLAALIQCFEWKIDCGDDAAVSMEEGPGITLPRAHPLVCIPVSRFPGLNRILDAV